MNTLKDMLVEILRGRLWFDDAEVPVLGRYYPLDRTPCVTMDDSSGTLVVDKRKVTLFLPLDPGHPQFDPDHPGALHPQECLSERKKSKIKVSVWCDNEKQRQDICNDIKLLLYQAETHHYRFCRRFDDGVCETLGEECKAIADMYKRGVKNQCPRPRKYRYRGVLHDFRIVPKSFVFHEPYSLDELEEKPPVLRSVFEVEAGFTDYYNIGGNTLEHMYLGDIKYE